MSFRFSRDDKSTAAGVRRIARQEIEAALAEIADGECGFEEKVHRVRRRCKKLRGLIRLVRPGLNAYKSANAAIRDAAAGLSHTRDAAVAVQTLDALAKMDEGRIDAQTYDGVREVLVRRVRNTAGHTEEGTLLAEFAGRMSVLGDTIARWRLDKGGFAALEGGLTRTYAEMGKAMRLARVVRSDENFHEWRKLVKYHWHHISLMRDAAPDVLAASRDVADELGETLGDHHNLTVLIAILAEDQHEERRTVQAAARKRQDVLAARAFRIGRQMTAETPKAFAGRFARYWALLRE